MYKYKLYLCFYSLYSYCTFVLMYCATNLCFCWHLWIKRYKLFMQLSFRLALVAIRFVSENYWFSKWGRSILDEEDVIRTDLRPATNKNTKKEKREKRGYRPADKRDRRLSPYIGGGACLAPGPTQCQWRRMKSHSRSLPGTHTTHAEKKKYKYRKDWRLKINKWLN